VQNIYTFGDIVNKKIKKMTNFCNLFEKLLDKKSRHFAFIMPFLRRQSLCERHLCEQCPLLRHSSVYIAVKI